MASSDRWRQTRRTGIRKYMPTGRYFYKYKNAKGKWVEKAGTNNLGDTADLLQAAIERATKIAGGTIDENAEAMAAQGKRDFGEVIREFRAYLKTSRGISVAHANTTARYCERFGQDMNVAELKAVTLDNVEAWLRTFDGARNHNYAMTSIKHLMQWGDDRGKIRKSPLRGKRLVKRDETKDRRRESRALTPQQFAALLEVAPQSRRVFYLIAGHTGCRWREVARLWWELVDLHHQCLSLPEEVTKTGEPADLPMSRVLIKELKLWRKTRRSKQRGGEADPLFDCEPRLRSWRMDLVIAGICTLKDPDRGKGKPDSGRYNTDNLNGYIDDMGRRIDRKCLRKSYGTWLASMEPNQSKVQKLMRHRDPKMTGNLYTDPALLDLHRIIEALDEPSKPAQKRKTK